MKTPPSNLSHWNGLLDSISAFLRDPQALRLDRISWSGEGVEQRSAYHSLLQIVRNRTLIEHLIREHSRRMPKARLHALLALAIIQFLESDDTEATRAKVVHHTVRLTRELCSQPESRFVNAVARAISEHQSRTLQLLDAPEHWHVRYSHPRWLVERWISQFGNKTTRLLLQWNQSIPHTYVHDLRRICQTEQSLRNPEELPKLTATPWPDFHVLEKAGRANIESLLKWPFYIQDPSTRIAPSLFEPPSNRASILDTCAAPGGKSLHLLKRLADNGHAWQRWIATDSSPERLRVMENNLERLGVKGIETSCVDWLKPLPESLASLRFDWVLLDAPCSSVGVIQRHPEIRWRLHADDYQRLPVQQLALLEQCSRLVRKDGQLVYSTCSFDPDENERVIEAFQQTAQGRHFEVRTGRSLLPHLEGHDGVGAFLLRRKADALSPSGE